MCGCNKKEKEITSSNEITAKDNLTFEYAEKIKLYDLVNSDRGITDNNDYIDTYKLGNNEITINYTNSKNEEDKVKVTYNVVDSTKPIILLSSSITAYKGKDINLVNSGICADNYDKKPNCYVEGEYDINKVGKYDLKYVAVDSNNNKNEKKFTLNVKEKKKTTTSNNSHPKKKYLIEDLIKEHKNDNTMIGIDVSSWQSDIDFKKVKDSGVEFVIIRIGFGHKKGEIIYDNRFSEYLKSAKENGLRVGLYFYSYAKNVKESSEQAKWIIEALNGESLDLPIAFDWEIFGGFNNYNLSLTDLNLIGEAFIKKINSAGYEGMLYSSKYYLENMWNLNEYKTWLAHYIDKTNYKGEYYIWQLSNTGKVNGIKGDVDLDILYK
ncbi:MAG: glycoside hydrolase family 25 [Tenericutes bacterium]|nr:glycoside hydrolase family 25 [Mycoplasmatota bacterium]